MEHMCWSQGRIHLHLYGGGGGNGGVGGGGGTHRSSRLGKACVLHTTVQSSSQALTGNRQTSLLPPWILHEPHLGAHIVISH